MSTCHRLPYFAAVFTIASIAAGPALAAELPAPFLAADFAPGADPGYFAPQEMAAVGGKIYFSATDPDHGREPWVSDGSAAGTRRLADLCFGQCSSYPQGFAPIGDAVVFHASDSLERRTVYRLEPGGGLRAVASFGDDILQWAALDSVIFFVDRRNHVYRTDGTGEGTRLVAEVHPHPSYELPQEMKAVGGAVYYADAGKLYRVSENDDAPQAIYTFAASPPWPTVSKYAALDAGRFVFRLCRPQGQTQDCRAWAGDGTGAGTRSLDRYVDGELTDSPENFVAWRGRIYFQARQAGQPYLRLVSTDGTPEGTRAEPKPSEISWIFAATSSHLFVGSFEGLFAQDAAGEYRHLADWGVIEKIGVHGERLLLSWGDSGGINPPRPGFTRLAVSDGTPDGTFDLREGRPQPGASLGGSLYFGFEGAAGRGLMRSDGSSAGTALVKASADVPRDGLPRPFRAGPALAVEAFDANLFAHVLHRLDPATLMTVPVGDGPLAVTGAGGGRVFLSSGTDYEQGSNFSYDGNLLTELPFTDRMRPSQAFGADGHHFFFTGGFPAGLRLWESDGSVAGTRLLDDLTAGSPGSVELSGDHVFYQSYSGIRTRIAVFDRATGERRVLAEREHFSPRLLALPGGRALFSERIYTEEYEEIFWRTDGSAAGTGPFLQYPAGGSSVVAAVAGNRFYLALPAVYADEAWQGLWAGDLSDAGVRMVVPTADRRYRQLIPAGDHLFFTYDSEQGGRELGFTDGSSAGTRFFDLRPGPEGSMPQAFHVLADQRLVFAAAGDGAGLELWISDGTESGTYRLSDLNPGDAASSPRNFLEVGGRLFFQASDGVHGRELWAIELPPARPACPAERLCLLDDRFVVKVTAHAPDGDFPGRRALAGAESGVFTFFSENNWEMLVKVLDGCGVNGAYWVSAAAASDVGYTLEVLDRASGASKTWESPAGAAPPILDIAAFPACGLAAPERVHAPALPPAGLAGLCGDGGTDLCLGPGGRYRVSLGYLTANGSGPALPVADGSADSGIFTFFSPTNWEMMVKVLDGCAIDGRVWVLAAGTTDVGWSLAIEDRETGARKTYGNPSGRAAPALVDLGAFACD